MAGVWGFNQRVIGGFAKWDVPDLVWLPLCEMVRIFIFPNLFFYFFILFFMVQPPIMVVSALEGWVL